MWLLIAEAGIALALLLFIVWWTMSGRSRNGRPTTDMGMGTGTGTGTGTDNAMAKAKVANDAASAQNQLPPG